MSLTALVLLTLLIPASVARGDEVLELRSGFATTVQMPRDVTGAKVVVGDPKIADVTFGPQNRFIFVGLKEGTTNVIVLDPNNGAEIYKANLHVGGAGEVRIFVYHGMNDGNGYVCGQAYCSAERQ